MREDVTLYWCPFCLIAPHFTFEICPPWCGRMSGAMLLILSPTDRHSIPNFRVTNHAAVNTLRRIPRCACAIIRLGHTLPEAEPRALRIHTFLFFQMPTHRVHGSWTSPAPRSGAGEATSKPCSPANASLTLLPAYLCFVKVAFPRSFNVHLSGC